MSTLGTKFIDLVKRVNIRHPPNNMSSLGKIDMLFYEFVKV